MRLADKKNINRKRNEEGGTRQNKKKGKSEVSLPVTQPTNHGIRVKVRSTEVTKGKKTQQQKVIVIIKVREGWVEIS